MPTSTSTRAAVLYGVLVVFTLSGAASAYFDWQAGRESNRQGEISRCIAGYRIRYVDGPAERARDAEKVVLRLVAIGETDTDSYRQAVRDFAAIDSNVDDYERVNRRARLHPEAFLRACREANP